MIDALRGDEEGQAPRHRVDHVVFCIRVTLAVSIDDVKT